MNPRRVICGLVSGIVLILIASLYLLAPSDAPITVEFVGLTNLPPTIPRTPTRLVVAGGTLSELQPVSPLHWIAFCKNGAISNLAPASPSHVLFSVKNCTTRPLAFRQCSHEFSPSILAGGKLPKAPSHHREAVAKADKLEEPNLQGYHGMGFTPPNAFFMQNGALKAGGGTLKAGETALLIVPRPPFDCVWRPVLVYDLRLSKPQLLLHALKSWLRVREKWQIYPERQGATYNECIKGLWMTNSALNKITGANAGGRPWSPVPTHWAPHRHGSSFPVYIVGY